MFGKKFGIYGKFGICSIPNFPKITKKLTFNSNFENREKLVPTQKPTRMFGLKFGMQGLTIWLQLKKQSSEQKNNQDLI